MRYEDSEEDLKYYRFIRYSKAAAGIIFAMASFILVIRLDGAEDHRYMIAGLVSMGIMSGIIFAMASFILVIRLDGAEDHRYMIAGLVSMGIMSGIMFDVKGVTGVVETIVEALPWTPKKPEISDEK